MKILVINPNTSETMTERLKQTLVEVKRADNDLDVVCADTGPEAIETAYDEAFCLTPLLEWVKKANQQKYDAVLIACFSDPGLEASREISEIPVIGMQEATLHVAAMLGAKFSILTARKERIPAKLAHVHIRGLSHFLASVRSLDMSVVEANTSPDKLRERILQVSKWAVEEDGAEVIVLGGAVMAGFAREVERVLGVKVLDPSCVGLKITEAIADLGLTHSKLGLYASPPEKNFRA